MAAVVDSPLALPKQAMSAKKRLIAVILSLILVGTALASSIYKPGDIDTDGKLTSLDVSLLVNHLNASVDINQPGSTGMLPIHKRGLADLDGDGILTTNDVHRLVDGILEIPQDPFPRPIVFDPIPSTTTAAVSQIQAFFNGPINSALLDPLNMTLIHLGRDRVLGTGDDSNIFSGTLTFNDPACALTLIFPSYLPAGFYLATVHQPIIGLNGKEMARSYSWDFITLGGEDNDNDGIPDLLEPLLAVEPGSPVALDPNKTSTLNDGIRDGDRDADGDDLSNTEEILRFTDPNLKDSDGDGWADGVEVADGKDPCIVTSHPDWSVFAVPPVRIIFDAASPPGPDNLGLILARPPVTIQRPGADEALSSMNLGLLVARPPIQVSRPSEDEIARLTLGNLFAQPGVEIQRPGIDESDSVGSGNLIAQPPVIITNKSTLSLTAE